MAKYSTPGVYRKEIDRSEVLVPNGTSTGAIVIRSKQGPVRRPVLVQNDSEFLEIFGEPYFVSGCDKTLASDFGGVEVPELGYGSYGALEFLKESNSLYVVRAYSEMKVGDTKPKDAYAYATFNTALGSSVKTTGIGIGSVSSIDIFDTDDRISSIDEHSVNPSDKLVFGYVSPGLVGDEYAVTVETLNPLSDWVYNFDNYPSDDIAINNKLSVKSPFSQTSATDTNIPEMWSSSGFQTKGKRFIYSNNVLITTSAGSTSATPTSTSLVIEVICDGITYPTSANSTDISAYSGDWDGGVSTVATDYVVPFEKLSFKYGLKSAVTTLAHVADTTKMFEIPKANIQTTLKTDGKVECVALLDVGFDGTYLKHVFTLGDSTVSKAGLGGATTVYKYLPIASEVVKVQVYKRPSDKTWEDLYSNPKDAQNKFLRIAPIETYYGSMKPMLDADGNELFLERKINGVSKNIYVKCNGSLNTNKTLTDASWDFANNTFKLPGWFDTAGNFVKNDSRFGIFGGGAVDYTHGLDGRDNEFWEIFENREEVPQSILINTSANQLDKMATANVCAKRKDCIVSSPVSFVHKSDYKDVIESESYGYVAPSYVALYSGYSKIYDQFNDKYVYLPNSIFAASIYARVDNQGYPWYAPAGVDRAILPVLDQKKIYSSDNIGFMYEKNINSVKLVRGSGFVLWGQKTAQLKKSALDRINVRRNLIYIENNIENSLQQFVFENNTYQTRLRVFSIVDEFLSGVKASDGLYAYSVVCDDSNNPPSVVDANQLNIDIYVQPVKAAEYIQFTTVVTRTGVSFSDAKIKY